MFKLANFLTGFNLICGILSIIMAFSGRIELAFLFIILGALFDFSDGLVARALKQQGELGKQLDSLADVVTFGVAPGLIVFVLFILFGATDIIIESGGRPEEVWMPGTFGYNINYWINVYLNDLLGNQSGLYPNHFFGWYLVLPFVSLFIPFMSLFRLAKFNIDTRQSDNFIGLPTPANAIFFGSFALLIWDGFGEDNWKATLSFILIQEQILMTLVVLFSFLLIAEIPLLSLKFKSFSFEANKARYLILIVSGVMLLFFQFWAIPLIILSYLLISILQNLFSN